MASPAAHRVGFLAQISRSRPLLEIGPAVRPALRGSNVKYFDITDSEGLIARAKQELLSPDQCPDVVHFVSPTGDLSVIDENFDALFSSHCIEHQADLIGHLRGALNILNKGGLYYLIIPDKRYCFDASLPESSVEDVIAAYVEKRQVHTLKSVIEHVALTTHNDPVAHWNGQSEDPNDHLKSQRMTAALERFASSNGGYIDVHAWQFTPASFRAIISTLQDRGMIPFKALRVYDTAHNRNEFCAVLRKT